FPPFLALVSSTGFGFHQLPDFQYSKIDALVHSPYGQRKEDELEFRIRVGNRPRWGLVGIEIDDVSRSLRCRLRTPTTHRQFGIACLIHFRGPLYWRKSMA